MKRLQARNCAVPDYRRAGAIEDEDGVQPVTSNQQPATFSQIRSTWYAKLAALSSLAILCVSLAACGGGLAIGIERTPTSRPTTVVEATVQQATPAATLTPRVAPTVRQATATPTPESTVRPEANALTKNAQAYAWQGHVASAPAGSGFDDYLTFAAAGVPEMGLVGADAQVEAQIRSLRDAKGALEYAHFWGNVSCSDPSEAIADYGGCQFVVTGIISGQASTEAEPVDGGWTGTLRSAPPGAQYDDAFVLTGRFPVAYGITGADAGITEQLSSLRDTGVPIIVVGTLRAGVPDAYGAQIVVMRLQVTEPGKLGTPSVTPAPGSQDDPYLGWQTYTSKTHGFSLRYPRTWELETAPNRVQLKLGAVTLWIAFRRTDEEVNLWTRTGLPGGDLAPANPVRIAGQDVTKNVLVDQGKAKLALYGGPGGPIAIADLEFLMGLEGPYAESLDIPASVFAEADRILESLVIEGRSVATPTAHATAAGGQGERYAGWATYTHSEYGLSFHYPPTWKMEELPARPAQGGGEQLPPAVRLVQGRWELFVQFHPTGKPYAIQAWGNPVQSVPQHKVTLLGAQIPRWAYKVGAQVKSVEYNLYPRDKGLVVNVSLHDRDVLWEEPLAPTIPAEMLAEVDRIVESLVRVTTP